MLSIEVSFNSWSFKGLGYLPPAEPWMSIVYYLVVSTVADRIGGESTTPCFLDKQSND